MDEGRESQELAIPGKITKSEHKGSIAQTVQNMLRKSPVQAITKTPTEQTPGEMSVERARDILKFIVNIPERGLDKHERHLTPEEQYKRFGGIHYEDMKKAFGVYADHLVTTHDAVEAAKHRPDIQAIIIKEGFPGPLSRNSSGARYYDLQLSIQARDSTVPVPRRLILILCDSTRDGDRPREVRVDSRIPLGDVKPDKFVEWETSFADIFSHPDPHDPGGLKSGNLGALGKYAIEASKSRQSNQWFHADYKHLWRGMRWTAANLLCWDENRIVYPEDLDKPPFNKGQAQLSKPKLELPSKQ